MSDFLVEDGQTFLFQGDSITDCGRRAQAAPLGNGYASLFCEMAAADHPERNIRYINKGIGGDKTVGLRDRWHDDVIRHQPDWLSVLIGINDLHTVLRAADPYVTVDVYRQAYDYILAETTKNTEASIVLLDPFYISTDNAKGSFRHRVLELIPEYIQVVDELAEKYGTYHVKTHDIFQKHLQWREPDFFCPEPVHPARPGHVVIARALMRALTAESSD